MKHVIRTRLLVSTLAAALSFASTGEVSAQSSARTTPLIESLFKQSTTAIDQQRYLQAAQLLTRLIGLSEHVHSQRAQELLGNVREANGQLAHAVAEYEIYLEKYPTGPGASRVAARLDAILTGSAPKRPGPSRIEVGDAAQSLKQNQQSIRKSGTVVRTQGSVGLFYRYNEGATKLTDLDPTTGIPNVSEREDEVFNNALSLSLRLLRVIEDDQRRITLSFRGNQTVDLEDSGDNQLRLYEALFRYEQKSSGHVLTFGRQRIKPTGIAYRLDGLSYAFTAASGVKFGAYVGAPVNSTRDDLFENDAILYGFSTTLPEGMVGPGEFSVYLVEQRVDGFTDRRGLGLEYRMKFEKGSLSANAEYDLQFGRLNRAILTGTHVFENSGRLIARLAHWRSPSLQLQNALIGQSARSLDELSMSLTQDEIEDLALARSAKTTTLGVTYYGPVSEDWDISAYGSIYDISDQPATTGISGANDVGAVVAGGVRTYGGISFIGSNIFRDRDQVNLGIRFAHSDDSDLIVASASMRVPFGDKWTVRPRVRIGYRDLTDGDEKFVIPAVYTRYLIDRQTSVQFELGGRWTERNTSSTIRKNNEWFFTGGIVRSF
ncbi:tetratricopeptide repeat protein [Ruegeria pomeroyi]|nr:tetratricopeptide repeat protein [Ruegeria pomeroyi]MCE8534616.1 tetratricopeptide repeat protein [Ruegeria pomeroyi]